MWDFLLHSSLPLKSKWNTHSLSWCELLALNSSRIKGVCCSPFSHHQQCTGDSSDYEQLSQSPYLEKLLAKDFEVIYFTESVDEYLMQHLTEFEDTQFQSAAKEKLTLGGKDDQEKKKEKALRVSESDFTDQWLYVEHIPKEYNWHWL